MKKLLCALLAMMLVLSSVSALAAGVAPATGTSPIKATAEVTLRTIKVTFTETPFDAADDVTFLFYIPENESSDNIIEENIIHADQIDYDANGFSFTLASTVEAGKYNLLIGGTDVDVPALLRVELADAVKYGDIKVDEAINSSDLSLLAQYLAGFDSALTEVDGNPIAKAAADVQYDSTINSSDLSKLAQHLAGFDSASVLGPQE
jgi:hypothetical protein